MNYDEILQALAQFNLIAWVIVAITSLLVLRYTRTKGWSIIMIGAIFIIVRQLWKFFPEYQSMQGSELIFNAYMMRFLFGSLGAIALLIGFTMLIANYYVMKTRMEDV